MSVSCLVIDGSGSLLPDPGLEKALELGKRPETRVWVYPCALADRKRWI